MISRFDTPVAQFEPPVTDPVRSTTTPPSEPRWMCAAFGSSIRRHDTLAQTFPLALLNVKLGLAGAVGVTAGPQVRLELLRRAL